MKKFFWKAVICAAALLCGGCGGADRTSQNYVDTAMGTVVRQGIYSGRETTARTFSEQTMKLLNELEQERLSWRLETSEVYRVNASAGSAEGYPLSKELAGLLADCIELSKASDGAFDIAIGALTKAWNMDGWSAEGGEDFHAPSAESLKELLEYCGSEKLKLEGETLFLPDGMGLDFGAVGKGFALTKISALLEKEPDITGAVISVGGSVLTYGEKPDGTNWRIGIANPFDTSACMGVLSLKGQWCVSTSGDYERYVEADGVRYHHILDPASGYPADSGVRGVTILSKDGMLGDGLSTACFILGPKKGAELAQAYGAEALFILADGELVMTEGMKEFWQENE